MGRTTGGRLPEMDSIYMSAEDIVLVVAFAAFFLIVLWLARDA